MSAIYVNFTNGTISNNPLSGVGTTVNSTAFADLPAIVFPDFMWMTLDPAGVDGDPEIVKITAHGTGSGTVTVTRAHQSTNARAHNTDTTWTTGLTRDDAVIFGDAAGTVKATVANAAPTGWLRLDGTAYAGANATYPALWAVAPASWKSGTTLTLPDTTDLVLMDGGTVGAIGGANSRTIATANLPAHTHDIDHNHPSATTSDADQGHVHDIDHNHPLDETSNQTFAHSHSIDVVANSTPGATNNLMRGSATGTVSTLSTDNETAFHQHEVDLPVTVGLVSGSHSQNHTHTVDLPVTSGLTSGSTGSGTALVTTPAHLRVNYIIKT